MGDDWEPAKFADFVAIVATLALVYGAWWLLVVMFG